jgi:hypothetical protein
MRAAELAQQGYEHAARALRRAARGHDAAASALERSAAAYPERRDELLGRAGEHREAAEQDRQHARVDSAAADALRNPGQEEPH